MSLEFVLASGFLAFTVFSAFTFFLASTFFLATSFVVTLGTVTLKAAGFLAAREVVLAVFFFPTFALRIGKIFKIPPVTGAKVGLNIGGPTGDREGVPVCCIPISGGEETVEPGTVTVVPDSNVIAACTNVRPVMVEAELNVTDVCAKIMPLNFTLLPTVAEDVIAQNTFAGFAPFIKQFEKIYKRCHDNE